MHLHFALSLKLPYNHIICFAKQKVHDPNKKFNLGNAVPVPELPFCAILGQALCCPKFIHPLYCNRYLRKLFDL